jgi:hypothetical protein
MAHEREWHFGTHHAWFESPDVLWTKIKGETTHQDGVVLLELYRELGSQRPIFVVTDLTEATSVDMRARDHVSWNLRITWFRGAAYIGAGLVQRAVASSMSFLHSLTGKQTPTLAFVSTEAEARAFIAQERASQDKAS